MYEAMLEALNEFFLQLRGVFMNIDWAADILDIILVAAVIYGIIIQLRKSQSIQVVKGLLLLAAVYLLVTVFNMEMSQYIFSRLFSDIIIIFIVLFSTDIRHALENVGKGRFAKRSLFFSSSDSDEEEVKAINAVCRACGAMSESKVGSLIIFQRESLLGDLTAQAVPIDSETTFDMLCSIFYPNAPLHDGAVIIKNGRIAAARCVVPMKNDRIVAGHVGTRHRAAVEASLNTDAVAVVTSEETGIISLAVDGKLVRGLSDSELREKLGALLLSDKSDKQKKALRKKEASAAVRDIPAVQTECGSTVSEDDNIAKAQSEPEIGAEDGSAGEGDMKNEQK